MTDPVIVQRKKNKEKEENVPKYCICRQPERHPMIGCDFCDEWYHGSCLNLKKDDIKELTKCDWKCPKCELPDSKKEKSNIVESCLEKSTTKKSKKEAKSKDDDIEYILPYGWKKIYRTRKNNSAKQWDVYVIAPCGKRFRSNVEINDYIKSNPHVECDLNVTNTKRPSDVARTPGPKVLKEKSNKNPIAFKGFNTTTGSIEWETSEEQKSGKSLTDRKTLAILDQRTEQEKNGNFNSFEPVFIGGEPDYYTNNIPSLSNVKNIIPDYSCTTCGGKFLKKEILDWHIEKNLCIATENLSSNIKLEPQEIEEMSEFNSDPETIVPENPEPNESNDLNKPKMSYPKLIEEALLKNPDGKLTLADIYHAISTTHPYYGKDDNAWKNHIRHCLTRNDRFTKLSQDKGSYWTLTGNLSESDLELIEYSKNQAKDQELPRPNLSYSQLIAEALVNSQNGTLILADIYKAISAKHPFYNMSNDSSYWKSSVRGNLTNDPSFVKDGKSVLFSGSLWKLSSNLSKSVCEVSSPDFNSILVTETPQVPISKSAKNIFSTSLNLSNSVNGYVSPKQTTSENMTKFKTELGNKNTTKTVFVCSYCNTNFSQMNYLDEHLKFNCTKILSQQTTDKYGENSTKSVFVCTNCNKNFTQMNYLNEHLKFNCAKILAKKQTEKTGEKSPKQPKTTIQQTIQCPICPAPYLLQNGELLKNHMWWVHKKELKLSFSCSFCSEKFHQKDLLTNHIDNNCAIAIKKQKNLDFDSVLVSENPNCSNELIENSNIEDPLGIDYFISWISWLNLIRLK